MNNFSVAGVGMYVTLISLILKAFGVTPPEGSVEAAVTGAVAVLGFVLFVYGQLRRKDLHLGLFRKV